MDTKLFIAGLKQCDIDTDKATSRFMGNEDLFIKFMLKLPSCMRFDDMFKYLDSENEEEFYMLIHNLKSNSGNLGVNKIADCAQAILVEFRTSKFVHKKKLLSLLEEAKIESELITELLRKYS